MEGLDHQRSDSVQIGLGFIGISQRLTNSDGGEVNSASIIGLSGSHTAMMESGKRNHYFTL